MKRKLLLFTGTLSLFFAQAGLAQITISEANFIDLLGTTLTVTSHDLALSAGLDVIAAASGPNQTWDFSNETVEDTYVTSQAYTDQFSGLPGSDKTAFAGADFAYYVNGDTAQIVVYNTLMDGNLRSLGSTIVADFDDDGNDDELSFFFSPPSLDLSFPIEYEKQWQDATTLSIELIPFTSTIETTTVVDGWGTVVTPEGSFSALRLHNTVVTTTLGFSETTVDIEFIAPIGVCAVISLSSGVVQSASYASYDDMSTAAEDETELPDAFFLSQNYPNPFNPTTNITYSLPASSHVTLAVYSMTGQEIERLVDQTQAPGTYEVSFDALNLASGVYLYRLETERFSQTRLMSLVK